MTCYRCGAYFYEIENIGQWKCNQHASVVPTGGEYWHCCGKVVGTGHVSDDGCVPSDHTTLSIPYSEVHNVPIPISIIQQLDVPLISTVLHDDVSNTDGDYGFQQVVVRRYDRESAASKGLFVLQPLQ